MKKNSNKSQPNEQIASSKTSETQAANPAEQPLTELYCQKLEDIIN